MNEIQFEKNKEARKRIEDCYGLAWEDVWEFKNWADVIAYWNLLGGGCVKCGGRVSGQNLKYYKFDVGGVKCYGCRD